MLNNLVKYYGISALVALTFIVNVKKAYSQIGAVVNTYTRVLNINLDTVEVNDATTFQPGEKAMLFQATGAYLHIELDRITPENTIALDSIRQAGIFEILIIASVDYANDKVIFESEVEKKYNLDEAIQLIEVKEYEQVEVNSELTCQPWDRSTGTGGVVVIIANKSITLNADINVSGKGFHGADPDDQADYLGLCSETANIYDSLDYYFSTDHRGALKGEGFTSLHNKYTKGKSSNANGGGGGNAKFSGGGGGGNVVWGGQGGRELNTCGNMAIPLPEGGQFNNVLEFYTFTLAKPNSRITFGGGGGTSNKNDAQGMLATKGGNGGGIVIIIADTIIGNGHSIVSNGESVLGTATAGAGGGGGGGALLMGVNYYKDDNLFLLANGGNGGNTDGHDGDDSLTGPGGGGGPGIIWHSFNALPGNVGLNAEADFGLGGINLFYLDPLARTNGAQKGADSLSGYAPKRRNLVLPLTGFLFNTVYNNQYMCEGDTAKRLTATRPKGGIGTYTYQWQKKTKLTGWTDVGTNNDSLIYYPGALTDTTQFRRVVVSGSFTDTSKSITIYVNDLITGNTIGDEQKICSAQPISPLTGNSYTGGDNISYSFQWEVGDDTLNFTSASVNGNNETYDPGLLNDTLYFRRKIVSGYCTGYSNNVLIQVLDPIENNTITDEQDVCMNNAALPFAGSQPTGGDNSTYAFTWQQSNNNSTWSSAVGTNNQKNFTPSELLTDTIYYRRFVTSGGGLCESNSNSLKIDVLPPVQNNTIFQHDTACQNDIINVSGALPQKGNNSYTYAWISGNNGITWSTVSGASGKDYTSGPLSGNIYYKRVVYSGRNNACIDSSNTVFIKVWNAVSGNTIAADAEYCEDELPGTFNGVGSPAGGDGVNYSYTWQIRKSGESYANLSGVNNMANYSFAYSPEPAQYYVRRLVASDVCMDYSDSVLLEMLPDITGNSIFIADSVCYNNESTPFESGDLGGGNSSTYGFEWQTSSNGTVFSDITSGGNIKNYELSGLTIPRYFRRIVTSGACKDTSGLKRVGLFDLPEAHLVNTVDTICIGNAVTLEFEVSGKSPWEIQYLDESGNSQTGEISNENKTFDITPQFSYAFSAAEVIDANNCKADPNTGSDNIIVYTFPVALGGDDIEYCGDETALDGSEGEAVLWEYNADSVLVNNVSDPKSVITKVLYGTSQLVYHIYNWQCEISDVVNVTFYEQPDNADGGGDVTLDYGTKTTLNAAEPTAGIGRWYDTDTTSTILFNNVNDATALVENLVRGNEYLLVWEVSNGNCEVVADTILLVSDELKTPQGFSPNGDGKNDYFEIKAYHSLDEGEYMQLRIVNRQGVEVYHSENYKNNWDGRSITRNDLPAGTYFYILKIIRSDGSVSGISDGFIVLKR